MRYLIVAYDFPPIPSPQALRWAYLANALARAGHEVHVLAPDTAGYGAGGLPVPVAGVHVHRAWPGPVAAFMRARQRRGSAAWVQPTQAPTRESPVAASAPVTLNWKGRLAERLKGGVSWFMFPDIRSEWLPWARRALRRLLDACDPDVVITSHEPANTILLGLEAKRLGRRWIADLGDPVLAPYTPWRWRRRAHTLERRMCALADALTVTNVGAMKQLQSRHGVGAEKITVLPQGFDETFQDVAAGSAPRMFREDLLELLYTGSFYAFRKADALLEAVAAVPGARLSIASMRVPQEVLHASERMPEQVRLLGFAAHRHALQLQRQCDVLVNLGNQDPVQIPGKLFEYLGARAPILNIDPSADSALAGLLGRTGAGLSVPDDAAVIASQLRTFLQQKRRDGVVTRGRGDGSERAYSWTNLAASLAELTDRVVRQRAVSAVPQTQS